MSTLLAICAAWWVSATIATAIMIAYLLALPKKRFPKWLEILVGVALFWPLLALLTLCLIFDSTPEEDDYEH